MIAAIPPTAPLLVVFVSVAITEQAVIVPLLPWAIPPIAVLPLYVTSFSCRFMTFPAPPISPNNATASLGDEIFNPVMVCPCPSKVPLYV